MSTHTSNEDRRPAAQESNRYRQLKSVGARVAKAPQGAASVVHETSRIAYGYTSRTVRDLKRADLRFHTNPADLAQAITVSAQATIADLTGNAATQIGKAGSKAATKATEVAETAATQMGNAGSSPETRQPRSETSRVQLPLCFWNRVGPSGRSAGSPSSHWSRVPRESEITQRRGHKQPRQRPAALS